MTPDQIANWGFWLTAMGTVLGALGLWIGIWALKITLRVERKVSALEEKVAYRTHMPRLLEALRLRMSVLEVRLSDFDKFAVEVEFQQVQSLLESLGKIEKSVNGSQRISSLQTKLRNYKGTPSELEIVFKELAGLESCCQENWQMEMT